MRIRLGASVCPPRIQPLPLLAVRPAYSTIETGILGGLPRLREVAGMRHRRRVDLPPASARPTTKSTLGPGSTMTTNAVAINASSRPEDITRPSYLLFAVGEREAEAMRGE